jgi:hypothetical protein
MKTFVMSATSRTISAETSVLTATVASRVGKCVASLAQTDLSPIGRRC